MFSKQLRDESEQQRQGLIQHSGTLGLFPALPLALLGSLEISISSACLFPSLLIAEWSMQLMVLGCLTLEGYVTGWCLVFPVQISSCLPGMSLMKPCTEIKHVLKSWFRVITSYHKGTFYWRCRSFLVWLFFFQLHVPADGTWSKATIWFYCIRPFSSTACYKQ